MRIIVKDGDSSKWIAQQLLTWVGAMFDKFIVQIHTLHMAETEAPQAQTELPEPTLEAPLVLDQTLGRGAKQKQLVTIKSSKFLKNVKHSQQYRKRQLVKYFFGARKYQG